MIAPNDARNWQVSMEDPAKIVEGVDDIVQSINIILTTIPGSDPLRRSSEAMSTSIWISRCRR